MRTLTLTAALAALLVACGDKDDGDSAATDGSDGTADAANGEVLYGTYCASCHGAGGLGEEESGVSGATNLQEFAPTASEAVIVDVILNGTGSMPPVGVSQTEAEDIAAFVKAQFGS